MSGIRPLSAELQKIAEEQLNEVPERMAGDLETLKTWIKQQPHLRARTDDQLLLAFLRGCKYSLEKTKAKIDKFNALRTKYPDMFTTFDVDEPKFREILRLGVIFYLPTPLHDNGPRIGIMRSGIYTADKYDIKDIIRVMCVMQEIILLEDDYANVNGIVFIADMAGMSAGHLFQITPTLLKKMTTFSEDAIPLRPKASHFVNTPSGFEPIFNIMKPMMSPKQQNRLFVHGNKMELLHQQIPKKYLPKEYGGENGTIDEIIVDWDKKVDEHRQFFKDNKNYGTDEKLRPGKPIDFETTFGIEGSFRKLNVD